MPSNSFGEIMRGKKLFLKILKVSGISMGSLLLILFILPFLFPKTIEKSVKSWINQSVTSKVDFSSARFTFFKHFPSLTFTLQDISITGCEPFEKDTLIAGKELSLGVDLLSLISSSIKVNQIFLSDARINILVDEKGNANYNIYRTTSTTNTASASNTGLDLQNIQIKNINLTYNDLSVPILIVAQELNYKGSGDLSKAVFDMDTRLSANSFSLNYNGQRYINNKQLKAKLTTAINTKSLSLIFQDNRVKINNLPVHFQGTFDFLQHGYKMNLIVESRKATLENIISAIPPDMTAWIENTKLGGDVVSKIQLKGIYDAATNKMPDLWVNLRIHKGFISYRGAAEPLQNLVLKLNANLPSMNPDSLNIQLDSLYFAVGKGFFVMRSYSLGMDHPFVESMAKADLDLGAWAKAIGLKKIDIKGSYKLDFNAKGKFAQGQNPASFRRDTIITSIPSFSFFSELRNGYFKFSSLPGAVQNIGFKVNSSCPDNNYRHTVLAVESIHLEALKNIFTGNLKLTNFLTPNIDANLKGNINLGEIEKFIPLEKIKLKGTLSVDAKIAGTFDRTKKLFPTTNARLSVTGGRVFTEYYMNPIDHIHILADVVNHNGKLSGTSINVQPISFEFEGQPFMLKANLDDPENISYDIVSKGTLDIGKLYKVFDIPGYELNGLIKTNLALKGKQSDAVAGRFQLLNNSGTLLFKDIRLKSELFPKPLIVHSGDFRFQHDKMWFDRFESSYGDMQFKISGYFQNVINYLVKPDGILKGKLTLTTDKINLNEFTTFGEADNDVTRAGTDSSGSGVILVPEDLSLLFIAKIKEANYDGVPVKNFNGQLLLDSGKLKLQQTNFNLAGATFNMDATYEGVTPHKGLFDFKVKADSFSVATAYKDIPLFREMVSSAKDVQGIVGLNYELSGRLNQNMMPVYPSLKGGGVINLKDVRLKGFKLLNAVSKSTDKEQLKDPSLKGINLVTTVNNNIITLEKVKLKIFGFRPRFEGQVSMDGDLNIKGRLGLPPFGIFGIPFTISGSSENPIVRLKKDKNGKIIQEKEDSEEEEENPSGQH